jgi:hypothetical protein
MGGIPANICGIHQCEATKCFKIHNPNAYRKPGQVTETPEMLKQRVAAEHLRRQEEAK